VSFGLVPAFVTLGLTPPSPPPVWLVVTCALLGVSAHLANAVPDVGLFAAHLDVAPVVAIGVVLVAAAGAVVVAVRDRGQGQALFRYVMVLALVAVLMIVLSARTLPM